VNKKSYQYLLIISGILLVGYAIYLYYISPGFTYVNRPSKENFNIYISVRILIGIIYTSVVVLTIRKRLFGKQVLTYIFVVGLLSRMILVPSEPILEDDFNRYLWDGAVTANGYNPYEYAPKLFIERDSLENSYPQKLFELADSSGVVIDRINHPHIRTIYPPVAQLGFSLAYLIKPWSTSTWKAILLICDILVFLLIIIVLDKLKYHAALVLIYWWNPILLHEIFNAGHMDLLLYPLIVGAILFYLKDRIITSSSLMAIAVGVKIWPIVFIPFVLKKIIRNRKLLITTLLIVSGIILIILLPIIVTKLDNSLGFVTYSKNWTNNESVFRLINILIKQFISLFNINYHCSLCIARWVVIIIYSIVILLFLKTKENDNNDTIRKLFYLVAIMFLLSPTQFPWYYTWVLPLLVFSPRLSFVAYVILLPLYQLKYSWPIFIWVEHIPILMLFIFEFSFPKIGNYLSTNLRKSQN